MSRPEVDHFAVDDRELIAALAPRLLAIARRQGLEAEDARDAVQEAFSRFLDSAIAPRLRKSANEATAYLTTVVVNVSRNMRRRHHRARPHARNEALEVIEDARPTAEERVAVAEESAQLRGCLEALEEVPRKIVSLRIIEDVSGKDVAKILDLSPNHVAVLLHRAKKDLSVCMTCEATSEPGPAAVSSRR